MKRNITFSLAIASTLLGAQAQNIIETPRFDANWSAGLEGGVSTPLAHGHSFFPDMRGIVGAHVQKQIAPAFGLGVEASFGVNTSSWYGHHSVTAFDNSYVGAYGAVNLMNLFGRSCCAVRPFEIELLAGAGWGHDYVYNGPNENYGRKDWNYFATRAGVRFNFNVNSHVTISLKPTVTWNMTGSAYQPEFDIKWTSAGYSRKLATFDCMLGLTYHFGPRFTKATLGSPDETEALNNEINRLRGEIAACNAATAAAAATAADLANQLQACQNRKPEIVKEVSNNLQSVRYIFYKVGSSVITSDQMPNVEMVASYLKNHKDATVMVKGYASQDGNLDFNIKLAQARAESVKNALVNKYGIKASRIKAEGEGIGHMFSENDWNRVSICTLE